MCAVNGREVSKIPLVSVGIPTFNRPEGFRRTLECITIQTYKNLEIIVSDNCSPGQDTESVVQEFMARDRRIQYYRQDINKGATLNFQFVLEKATGEYFMWAADDDIHEREFIRTLITPLDSHLEISAAMCSTKRINESGQFVDVVRFPQIEDIHYNSFQMAIFATSHVNLTFFFHGLFRTNIIRKFNQTPDDIFGKDLLIVCEMLMSTRIHWVNKVLFTKGIDNTRNTEYLAKNKFCWLKLFFNFAPYLAKSKNIPTLRKFWIPLMMINHAILIGKIYTMIILPPMPIIWKKSYSLNNLDLKLKPYINFKDGFFVEVGANDGVSQSNTLYFEKYLGWKGLLIEAIPEIAERCRQNRPKSITENCALVAFDYPDETIEINFCNLMSCVQGAFGDEITATHHINSGKQFLRKNESIYRIKVAAKPLSAVLDFYLVNHIDFMSLDVEGYEVEVLRGIDFDRHAPDRLLIEVRPSLKKKIEEIICKKYKVEAVLNTTTEYSDILYSRR